MSNRIAAFIVNYNMPERADALLEHIAWETTWPVDAYLIDNGSDIAEPSKYTNVWIDENLQTTNGWLAGLEQADSRGIDYFAYWFLITSAEFIDRRDVLTPIAQVLQDDPEAVAVSPALTRDSTTIWDHMYDRGSGAPRRVWYIDQIAALYRADWFNQQGRWDRRLTYAHGIGLKMCYWARRQGRSIWIQEACKVKKVTDIGYTMDRMNMSADQRRANAKAEMDRILGAEFGPDYWNVLRTDGVKPEWR